MRAATLTRSVPAVLVLTLAGCGMRQAMAEGDALRPSPYDPLIAKFVEFTIQHQHFDAPRIDDRISTRWLDAYLDALDPQRWYFLQTDVDEFRAAYGQGLDDALHANHALDPAFTIYERFQRRVQERLSVARGLLDDPVDFTLPETLPFDRSEGPWPASTAEADDLWRRVVKNELLAFRLGDKPEDEARDLLRRRYDRVEKGSTETEASEVREIYLNALTMLFDPHTNYFAPSSSDDFHIELANQLEGIGAELRFEDGYTVVKRLITGGPADRSDELQPEDKIVAVAQDGEVAVDIVEMKLDKVVQLIRGPKGTKVHLTIVPAGEDLSAREVVTITRDKVELKDRLAKSHVVHLDVDGRSLDLGVVELPSFYAAMGAGPDGPDASEDVKKELLSLKSQGVHGVVFDLRENGGGSLTEAVEITGLFLDRGPVVQVGSPRTNTEVLADMEAGMAWEGPLVVLTSPLSASASEIVAGAVQDYGRGLIVGSKTTHGKGTVQTILPLDPLLSQQVGRRIREPVAGDLKLTTQKFYRVTGGSTQHRGVESDIVLPSRFDGMEIYEADLDNALPWDTVGPTRYRPVGQMTPLLDPLRARSAARVAGEPEFQKLQNIAAYRETQKDRESFSLVLTERQAEAEATKALLGHDEDDEPAQERDDDAPDAILMEALHILGDLATYPN